MIVSWRPWRSGGFGGWMPAWSSTIATGIAIVELSLTAALVGFGGDNAGVVAAVLVYRFLTIVPKIALGLLAAAAWRVHGRGERSEP
jgi:uncharacterized membrane protein YbhN (UPF0104 family)